MGVDATHGGGEGSDGVASARCPFCLLEAPSFSLEQDPACGLCETKDSAFVGPAPPRFATEDAFMVALARFQVRSGYDDLALFVRDTFVLGEPRAVYAAYSARRPLELVADPFGVGPSMVKDAPESLREPAPDTARLSMVPLIPREAESGALPGHTSAPASTPGFRSRAPLYALASVAAADGIVGVEERWFMDECLRRYGEAPARDDEIRVYSPMDWASAVPVQMRAQVAFDMCTLAMIDGLPDAAEARMIYAYCIEWRIPTEEARKYLVQLQRKNTSFLRRVWLLLRDYLLPGRWENTRL